MISDTGNKKASKTIVRYLDKIKEDANSIYHESIESRKIQNATRPHPGGYFVGKVGDEFHIDKTVVPGERTYSYTELLETAFKNTRFWEETDRKKKQENELGNEKNEETSKPVNYVENEMQELRDVEEYWNSEDFQKYVGSLEKNNPKKFQKYQSAQSKKEAAVEKLKALYPQIAENKESLAKIEQAKEELENLKMHLPARVYKKCEKALKAQQKKLEVKQQRLQNDKDNIFKDTGLGQSVNNAKKYHENINRLSGFTNEQVVDNHLKGMQEQLKEAEEILSQERKMGEDIPGGTVQKQQYGDFYDTNEVEPNRNTNQSAIDAAQKEVDRIRGEITKQIAINEQNAEEKIELENEISALHQNEVETTIETAKKGKTADTKALPAGNYKKIPNTLSQYVIDPQNEPNIQTPNTQNPNIKTPNTKTSNTQNQDDKDDIEIE